MKNIKKTLNQNNPLGRHSGLRRNDAAFAKGLSGLNNATACGLAMTTAFRLCEEAKPTKQSRNSFRRFLSALGLTVAFLAAPSAYASVAGYVQFVNGNVQITSPTGQVRPAQKGDAINEGDTLTSAQKSSVQVKMQDGGFVAVRPDTQLKFDQFVFAGKEDGSEKSFYSLFKGGFRAVTGLIGRINKQNYKITTPAATIGIRGTDHETFLITPDSPLAQVAPPGAYNKVNVGETYVATDKGTIFVQPNQMGFAGGMDQMPQVQPVNTKVFTVAEAATPEAKAEKKEEKEEKAEAKQEEKVAKGDKEEKKEEKKEEAKAEATAEAGAAEAAPVATTTQEETAPVRETAIVDAAPPATGGMPAATAPTVTATTVAEVIAPPPTPTTVLTTATITGGTIIDITAQTGTNPTTGVTQPITNLGISGTAAYLFNNPLVTPGTNVTVTDAATIAQLTNIDAANGAGTLTYTAIGDTRVNLTANVGIYLTGAINATVLDTVAIADLAPIVAMTTGAVTAAILTDTVTNLAPTGVASVHIGNGSNVTVTDAATIAQMSAIDAANGAGMLTYTAVSDTAANLFTNTGGYVMGGKNVTVTGAASIVQLSAIDTANTTGTLAYTAVTDTAAALAGSVYVTGGTNVTVTDAASIAQLSAIDTTNTTGTLAYTAVTDTAVALAGSTGVGGYVTTGTNITVTDAATVAQATAIDTANSVGTLVFVAGITDAAASLVDATGTTPATGVAALLAQAPNVTVTGAATIAQLTYINNTNSTGTVSYTTVTDTAVVLAGSTGVGGYVTTGTNITVTDAATIAQLTGIDGANGGGTLAYTTVGDTVANLTANAGSYVVAGTSVAVTDAASLAQLVTIDTINGAGTVSFTNITNANAEHRILFDVPVTGGVNEGWIYSANPSLTANSSYLFDGNNNLTGITDTPYRTYDQVTLLSGIINADIQFIGGTSYDKFTAADNSIYMGRWAGGSMSVTDLTAPTTPFTVSAGTSSTHWVLAQMVPEIAPGISKVQNMVGTTTYTMNGATRPTDSFGNVGSVTSATLSADFTTQTVATAAQLTFSATDPVNISAKNMVFDISQPGIPITGSTFVDTWPNVTTSVLCSGADCTAGIWSAWLDGSIAGDAGKTAFVGYNLYNRSTSTPATGTPYNDMVRSIVAFTSATAPSEATNPPAGTLASFGRIPVGSTGVWERGRFNVGSMPQTNTNFVLDASGNLVRALRVQYNERPTWGGLAPATNSYTDATVSYSGGVANDFYSTPDGSVTIGRWTGGQMTIADNLGALSPLVKNLGSTSSHWMYWTPPAAGFVQALVGTTTYTQVGATLPTDTFGNVGTMPVATLSADFTNQTIDANVAFSIASQNLTVTATGVPIEVGGDFADAMLELGTAPSVTCTGTCAAGYLGNMTTNIAGPAAMSADIHYSVWPTASQGSLVSDIIQGIVVFSAGTVPSVATNPAAGNWNSFGHMLVGSTAAGWQRGRFNTGANPDQPNTNFILDGAGNLVRSLHVQYNDRYMLGDVSPATNQYADAMVTYSGGVASDHFTDGSVAIGRWTGGQMTIVDNLAVLPTLVNNLGVTSSYWFMTSSVPVNYVQSLLGTTTYTQAGATLPTDSFGNVGTLPVATLSANFTNQTVAASVAFTIASQGLNISNSAIPIVAGTEVFEGILEFGTAPTVSCTGAGCSGGGYLGWLTGGFAGTQAASANLAYKIWPTAPADSLVSDIIQGVVAFNTGTAPTAGTNPPAGTWSARGHMLLGSTATGWGRGRFNAGNFGDLPHTNFILDGTGNLVRSLHVNYNERYTQNAVSPAANQYADAMVTYSGGTAYDHFTDGSVAIGRWTGGQMTIVDNLGVLPTLVNNLGVTSSYWFMTSSVPVNYVQSLVGTTTYTQFGATLPTDSLGNVGTLPVATLSANFTNQTVAASVAFTIASQGLNISNPAIPIVAGTEFFEGTLELGTAPTVMCTGAGCSGGSGVANSYLGWLTGGFAGAQAASANLAYKIWPTAPADSLVSDLIQGVVAFNTATSPTVLAGGPFAAYVPSGVTVALSSPNWWSGSGWDNSFTVAPADIAYTGGLPSGFTNSWGCPGCGNTTTVLGAANPVNGLAISNTGIEFGRWTTSTAIQHTYVKQLGTQYGAPDSWMYGPRGYLDAAYTGVAGVPIGAMAATFSYQLDGNTAPYDRYTGLNGTLTSATLTANFTAMTVSAALGLSMPGGETWAANVTNQPVYGNSFSAYANAGGAVNTLTITRNAAACPTCGGNLQGGFTGQNYAGAILSYQLYDNNALSGGEVVGRAALTRFGVAGNPAVTNGTPAPTGTYFVADWGGSLQWVDAITATGNLLTAYSSGTPGISGSSTTVTCTTCTTAATGDVANSGIYYGAWQAGGWTNTWGGNISPGQFHWITGPEAGPVYLPEVLTGTVTYALDGGTTPTNWAGTAGTLSTATLTANFTKQVVGISLSALVAGNTWSASTAAGNEAPLDYVTGFGKTAFYASSYQGGGPGTLTVSVSNANGTLPADGWVSGNLTGSGLTGAVLSYTLQGGAPTISPGMTLWDQVNGVAAFVAPPSDIAAPYRMVEVALTDPTAAVPLTALAGLYNAASRVTSDVTGNLTQFDIWPAGNGSANSLTVAPGTSTLANFGSDPLTGISWGRWQGGAIDVTDRATGVVTPITLQGSAHWLAGPTMTAPVTLPVSGTFAYTLAGGTVPTDNLGTTGTLNSATLSADFTAQTVDVGVNATVGATTLGASATGVPIIQGAGFAVLNPLAVTCAGTCGAVGSHGGQIIGGFTGAGATGAGMMYSLGTGLGGAGATVISGVAAFHR